MSKIKIYLKSIAVPIIVGALVGIIMSKYMDYNMLVKPKLAPPSLAFPIVWTILYILMGVSYGILKSNDLTDSSIDLIYYLQLAVNALWSIIFFVFKWRLFAFIWIILLAILVIDMIIKFYNKNKIAGLLNMPYLLWIGFASYLNWGFYILNK